MLEVSQERQRRDRGEYSEPSPFFRRAMTATQADTPKPMAIQEPAAAIPPATFACTASSEKTMASETVPASNRIVKPQNALAKSEEIVPSALIVEETAPSSPKPQGLLLFLALHNPQSPWEAHSTWNPVWPENPENGSRKRQISVKALPTRTIPRTI